MLRLRVRIADGCGRDRGRALQGRRLNVRIAKVIAPSSIFESRKWKDIRVVESDEFIPADLVLISSSEPGGFCFIETSNLDGETNLKIKQTSPSTAALTYPSLNYQGTLKLLSDAGVPRQIPIGLDQMLLCGAQLRNTPWIYGIVVFIGHETKLMRNATAAPIKKTAVEKQVNVHIIFLFGFLLALSVRSTICASINTWYLFQSNTFSGRDILTFIILYNNLVPISLIVTVEVVKFQQAALINSDLDLYYARTDTPALCRTSFLIEELGQIEFIFSDKTGILLRNEVELSASIGGVVYAEEVDESRKADAEWDEEGVKESWRTFDDRRRVLDGTSTSGKAPKNPFSAEAMAMAMSDGVLKEREVAHQFMALLALCHTVIPEVRDGKTHFRESSPDEAALAAGAEFVMRKSKSVFVYIQGQTAKYEILNLCEFNSTRKRMSTVVRAPDDKINLYFKRRNKALDEAAELIEKMILLGATVIEDKLQEGVPDTIHTLQEAGIKIWVLTGDRQETAINIGVSCRLVGKSMNLVVANEETARETAGFIEKRLSAFGNKRVSGEVEDSALVHRVTLGGKSLMFALEKEVFKSVLEGVAVHLPCVVCRLSPLQKALAVVKKNQNSILLVIGYGANDVSMIQAHVGGLQAARSADIVISQFRYLKKLLVHGAWSFQLTLSVLDSFYKNMTLYMTQFLGTLGIITYESWTISFYNVIFTVLPPLVIGIFDQFVSARNAVFTKTAFWLWIGSTLYRSLILLGFLVVLFWGDLKQSTGLDLGHWIWGTALGLWIKYTVAAIPGSFVFTMVFPPLYALVAPAFAFSTEYADFSGPTLSSTLCCSSQEVQKYNVLDYRPRQAQFQKAIKKAWAVQRMKRNPGFAFSRTEGGAAGDAGDVGRLDQTGVMGVYGMAGVKPTGY
ncbi:phospholipid-translocating P-type ATPase [Boletus coccyginus]|nr:phospholipid-translocating P-type ATPase [Boletus coccyginus]